MIQSVSLTSATFEDFVKAYLGLLTYVSAKKNTEVIKFVRILKKYVSRIKYIFVQERKAILCLIKKLLLSFTQLSNLIS